MQISKEQNNRLDVIDVAKGIGMLLVIYCHVSYQPDMLIIAYGCHMPLFFILSGFLFNHDKYDSLGSFLKKRMVTLIIPYITLYMVSLAFSFLTKIVSHGFSMELVETHLRYFINMFLAAGGSGRMVYAPFWFVLSLFLTEIIYFVIRKNIKSKKLVFACVIALSVLGWLLQWDKISFPKRFAVWNFDSSLFVVGFYAIGNLLRERVIKAIHKIQANKRKILVCILLFTVCCIVYLPVVYFNGKISIGSKILNNGLLTYATGIIGTAAVMLLSMMIEKCRFLSFCGKNSFYLMSFHCMMIVCVRKAMSSIGMDYEITSGTETIIPFVLAVILTVIATIVFQKAEHLLRRMMSAKQRPAENT